MLAGNLDIVFVRTDKVSTTERQRLALDREELSYTTASDRLAPEIRASLATLRRETATADETAQAAKHLQQVSRSSSRDIANQAAVNRQLLCEAGGVCFGCRALGRFPHKKGGAREAVKALLTSLILPDNWDGTKAPSRDLDTCVSIRDIAHLMIVDNQTLRSQASRTLLGRLDAAMLKTAQPFQSGRLVVTAGQDEYGEPELLKLLMVLAESPLLMESVTDSLLQSGSQMPTMPRENLKRRQRTKEEASCLLHVLRTMAGALTLRAQGQSKQFTECCVHVIASACYTALPFVLESATGGRSGNGSSATRTKAIETLSHLACSSQIAKAMLLQSTSDVSDATLVDRTTPAVDVLSVVWTSLASTDTRLGAVKTAAHLAASCRNVPGCVSRLALTRQLYAKLLHLAKHSTDKNEMLHCLKAVDLMVCDESVAIAISADRSALEMAIALLSSARGDWHETHRVHIQSTAVSIIARVSARVSPAACEHISKMALAQLLSLVITAPAAVQNVTDLALGNLAKKTPQVLALFSELTGKNDKSRLKGIWTYLATNHPHISYLALLCLKDTLRSHHAREKFGKGDVGKTMRESKVRTIVLQLQTNRHGVVAQERAQVAAEILGEITATDERLHKLAVEAQALQACSVLLSTYGSTVPVALALAVLRLLHGLSAADAPGVSVSVPAAHLVQHQQSFLSHNARPSSSDYTVPSSPGAVSLIALIRHPEHQLQHAALRCYVAVTINDSENTYRFAPGIVFALLSAASSGNPSIRSDAVRHLETLFAGDGGSLAEATCVDLGKAVGIGEVFDLVSLRAELGEGPTDNVVLYRCVASPGAALRAGPEMTSDQLEDNLTTGQIVMALEETVNSKGIRRVRCDRGWCSVESKTGERILERADTDEAGRVELHPADFPTLLPVRRCALLSLRRLLRESEEDDQVAYVRALSQLILPGAMDTLLLETTLFTIAEICLDTRLRSSVGRFISVERLFELATAPLDTNNRVYGRLVLLRLTVNSTRNANQLLVLRGSSRVLLECAASNLWLDAARAIAQVLWMAEQAQDIDGGGGATQNLIEGGGVHSVLRLAAQSIAVDDTLLVAKALNALCQDEKTQADVLQITASHSGGNAGTHSEEGRVNHDSVIRTLIKLERNAHSQSRTVYDQHCEVKREIWQALQSLSAQQRNHTRLKSDGVGTLCIERCADSDLGSTQTSEADSLARQVLQQLDPNADQTVLAAAYRPAKQLVPRGVVVPHYWKPQSTNQQMVECEIQRGSWEWMMLEQQMNANIHKHGSKYGTVPGSGKDPRSFPMVRAVRIQNLPLWRDYAHRRETMLAKYGDALAHSDANEWLSTRPILTATNQVVGLLEHRANENFLFHGTDATTAETLKQTGFDARVSSLVGMFGGGSYFAENSSKSNQYIPGPEAQPTPLGNPYQMLFCRVLLGDIHVCHKYDQDKYRGTTEMFQRGHAVRRPPNKPSVQGGLSGDVYDR